MRNQDWQILSQSTTNHQQQLHKLISYIFTDQYIYVHPQFCKILTQDRKGYVKIQHIVSIDIVIHFFKNTQINQIRKQVNAIQITVEKDCHQLFVKNGRIRRLNPFDTYKMKEIKPICIEKVNKNTNISDLRQYLGNTAFSTTQNIIPQQSSYVLIYAPDYRHHNIQSNQSLPFKLVNYQNLCRERDRQSRFWQQQERKMYRKLQYQSKAGKERWSRGEMHKDNDLEDYREHFMEEQKYNHKKANFEVITKMPNPALNQLLQDYWAKSVEIQ